MATGFTFPPFHDYPPYYTLQPVDITREKQCNSWGSLILNYCRHYKIFTLRVDDSEDFDLFCNQTIKRSVLCVDSAIKAGMAVAGKLAPEAKRVFFDWLVKRGEGMWKDKQQQNFLVLWKTIPQWADALLNWVYAYGLEDSVLTVDEISHGDETSGTELEGLDRDIVIKAVSVMESKGRAKMFQGTTEDDVGIKFFKQHST